MPYHVEKRGPKYLVVKDRDGHVMGHHPNKEKAAAQVRALYANDSDMKSRVTARPAKPYRG